MFSGHYDTTLGHKREVASYQAVAQAWGLPAAEILFLSDLVEELDAARSAGMATGLCLRPGNKAVGPGHGHAEIVSFEQVQLGKLEKSIIRKKGKE